VRIFAIYISGVGGVPDGRLELPRSPIIAFAGGNGTGKSKLLACLLSPWTRQLPPSQRDQVAEVQVEVELDEDERFALGTLSRNAGWGDFEAPERVMFGTRVAPMVGPQPLAEPPTTVMLNALLTPEFLRLNRSLDVVYLPAERRLLASGQVGIDLNQLTDLFNLQKGAEARGATQNYGRLDDQEFEQFAKALCVAEALPEEPATSGDPEDVARIPWSDFVTTVNTLIEPKELLGLTRGHPDELRIRTPSGALHGVQDLSSGERQALIIISRVLRNGQGPNRVVIVDEPDAYLHPHLSTRLIRALEEGVGDSGQLIVATHSPSVLDNLSTAAIIRLGQDQPARLVADESERVELYRSNGFRASALTQSDLLVITEGDTDDQLLKHVAPGLTRASVRAAGGRVKVLREVEQLSPYELPVLGVVDRDLMAEPVTSDAITVWPKADIEAVFLAEDAALETMLSKGLASGGYTQVGQLRALLDELAAGQRDNIVAELAQRILREHDPLKWPSPKGNDPIERLREATVRMTVPDSAAVDAAIARAEQLWTEHAFDPFVLVRGKYISNTFASRASSMDSGHALLDQIARARPPIEALERFNERVEAKLA